MPFEQIFSIALKALWINKVRSFLTMLGVIIGVGSVVLLTSIGTGLQSFVTEQFDALGSNIIFVVPGNPLGDGGGFGNQQQAVLERFRPTLKREQLDKIIRDNRDVILDGTATAAGVAQMRYRDVSQNISLYGVTDTYERVQNHPAEIGKWFTQADESRGRRVILLGSSVAEEFFGAEDPIGREIRLDAQRYTVIGVLESKGGGFGGPNFDSFVYVPLKTLQDNFNVEVIANLIFIARDAELIPEAIERIESYLLTEIEEDKFSVYDQTELLATINEVLGALTVGLGGIAAISLVVGGIGIMNIMLVSVTERTREIGLRKALGATPNIILTQFLIEAALLSIIGGGIGLIIAYFGSIAMQAFFPARVTMDAVMLAFGVSTVVGLVFGAAPARRAAKLSPIEALRYE
jgi:putative ABC transport system permease protein